MFVRLAFRRGGGAAVTRIATSAGIGALLGVIATWYVMDALHETVGEAYSSEVAAFRDRERDLLADADAADERARAALADADRRQAVLVIPERVPVPSDRTAPIPMASVRLPVPVADSTLRERLAESERIIAGLRRAIAEYQAEIEALRAIDTAADRVITVIERAEVRRLPLTATLGYGYRLDGSRGWSAVVGVDLLGLWRRAR